MPKKTKREKIIAEYRRKLTSISDIVPTSTPSAPYIYHAKTEINHQRVAEALPMDSAIRRDLIKTLILASIAIVGEVAFSYII